MNVETPTKPWRDAVDQTILSRATALMAAGGRLLIGGAWTDASDGGTIDSENPCDETVIGRIARGTEADATRAVAAARAAFDRRPAPSTADRAAVLLRLADLVERDGDLIAALESLENGKPFRMARGFDLALAVSYFRYAAGAIRQRADRVIEPYGLTGEWHAYTRMEPVGVAVMILPWNAPVSLLAGKLAAAYAAGCAVVVKPAEQTSFSALHIAALAAEAGMPDGFLNVVTGYGADLGTALVVDPDVDKISFTGSAPTAQAILRASSANLTKLSLELGGKSPTFVFEDADLARAPTAAAMGIFGNSGQICAAGSRLYVHEKVYDEVVDRIVAVGQRLRLGDSLSADTDLGPLVSAPQRRRVAGYVEGGVAAGAELLCGGAAPEGAGHFFLPTVFARTAPDMAIVREEIFGPVLTVQRFADEDLDTLATIANATRYGLSAAIWSENFARAHRFAARIKSGTVKINAGPALDAALPFGGMKESGWGRENGAQGIEGFMELKTVIGWLA